MRSLTQLLTLCLLLFALGGINAQCDIDGYAYGGSYNGHHYYFSDAAVEWPVADAAATALGGYLATIADAGENVFVATVAGGGGIFAWIGFTDQVSEGTFEWVTGEPVTFTGWNPGEPNNEFGIEDWTEINRFGSGTWNDLPAGHPRRYVVEFGDDDCDGTSDYCDDTFDDADCDGVGDGCDNCDGGDDSGPCDATSFPGFEEIPSDWVCHANGHKVYVCHNGETICVDFHAVQAHLDHGDFLGPCSSCDVEERSSSYQEETDVFELNVKMYPNPASDEVTISLYGFDDATATVTVLDKLGRVVMQKENQHEGYLRLSLKNLLSGEHFIQVVTADQVVTKKLLVVK